MRTATVRHGECRGGSQGYSEYVYCIVELNPYHCHRFRPCTYSQCFGFCGLETRSRCPFKAPSCLMYRDESRGIGDQNRHVVRLRKDRYKLLRSSYLQTGRFSCSERKRGCRQSAHKTVLKGQPCLIPLWIEMGPAKTPLICTEVVAWSFRACILSKKL